MKRLFVLGMLAAAPLAAAAVEGEELAARSKSLAAAAAPSPDARNAQAPFRVRREALPELLLREELERRGPRGACETTSTDLCYDMADRRIVYRPARAYMPSIGGLTPENVSLRRDRIVLKYSFR